MAKKTIAWIIIATNRSIDAKSLTRRATYHNIEIMIA